jgi:hypothetical protein
MQSSNSTEVFAQATADKAFIKPETTVAWLPKEPVRR